MTIDEVARKPPAGETTGGPMEFRLKITMTDETTELDVADALLNVAEQIMQGDKRDGPVEDDSGTLSGSWGFL